MRSNDPDDEKPPAIKLTELLETQRWARGTLSPYRGVPMDVGIAKRLAIEFNTASNGDMPTEALFNTFVQYVGTVLTNDFADILSFQIAARRKELRNGALVLYTHPIREEWVPLEVVAVAPAVWRQGSPGVLLSMRALGGHPAGHVLVKKLPETWMGFFARVVGCSMKTPYGGEPWVFQGLLLWGYLVPDVTQGALNFKKWGIGPNMRALNKDILKRRLRFNVKNPPLESPCPFEFDVDCNQCTKVRSECPASLKS